MPTIVIPNNSPMPGENYEHRELTLEEKEAELRMWLIVRTDIEIPRPKFGAQAGHGYLGALWRALLTRPLIAIRYMTHPGQAKITVAVKNLAALQRAHEEAKAAGLPSVLVLDSGRTIFSEPTYTVVGVGPCVKAELPKFIQKLQLLKE